MSVINTFERKKAEQKLKEIYGFLQELDLICDMLYNRLDYPGVWNALMELEEVRIQYYVEHYELKKIIQSRGNDE